MDQKIPIEFLLYFLFIFGGIIFPSSRNVAIREENSPQMNQTSEIEFDLNKTFYQRYNNTNYAFQFIGQSTHLDNGFVQIDYQYKVCVNYMITNQSTSHFERNSRQTLIQTICEIHLNTFKESDIAYIPINPENNSNSEELFIKSGTYQIDFLPSSYEIEIHNQEGPYSFSKYNISSYTSESYKTESSSQYFNGEELFARDFSNISFQMTHRFDEFTLYHKFKAKLIPKINTARNRGTSEAELEHQFEIYPLWTDNWNLTGINIQFIHYFGSGSSYMGRAFLTPLDSSHFSTTRFIGWKETQKQDTDSFVLDKGEMLTEVKYELKTDFSFENLSEDILFAFDIIIDPTASGVFISSKTIAADGIWFSFLSFSIIGMLYLSIAKSVR